MDFSFFQIAQASPPPDFLYQAGNQMIQVSSVAVVAVGLFLGWVRTVWMGFQEVFGRRTKLLGIALLSILVLMGGVWFYHASSSSWQANFFGEITSQDARIVSESKLAALLDQDSDLILLDVREDEERRLGFIPGSRHVRMADIFAGAWEDLPRDRVLYLHCATGTRSRVVARFLKQQGFEVAYLNGSLEDWSRNGRPWEGDLAFQDAASKRLQRRIKPDRALEIWQEGALLVDARQESWMNSWRGVVSLPVLDLTSEELQKGLQDLPAPQPVVILADKSNLHDFSAFLAAVKLHALGYEVKGTLFQPEVLFDAM